jgi:hypothetical protein
MAALVAAIHGLLALSSKTESQRHRGTESRHSSVSLCLCGDGARKPVDARHKAGHDEPCVCRRAQTLHRTAVAGSALHHPLGKIPRLTLCSCYVLIRGCPMLVRSRPVPRMSPRIFPATFRLHPFRIKGLEGDRGDIEMTKGDIWATGRRHGATERAEIGADWRRIGRAKATADVEFHFPFSPRIHGPGPESESLLARGAGPDCGNRGIARARKAKSRAVP